MSSGILTRNAAETRRPEKSGRTMDTIGQNAVELKNVTVTFPSETGHNVVVDDFSLTVEPGEFLVLVGRSGCGKTTILNLVAGVLEPTRGTVSVYGDRPANRRSILGYMFARDALLPWRTAVRNVELGLEILGSPRGERRDAALEMLKAVGLGDAAKRLPWQLSQGMRQRVALARTWVRKPKLLLMDEPFAALDAQTRNDAQQTFLEIWQGSRAAVILVTHDLHEALLLADRVVLLSEGRILKDVRPSFSRPRDIDALARSEELTRMEAELRDLLS
ncbi:ABC transporter ATP-binding protein [Dietzia kunjamensis]|uniref:ABC transporter ATP-binding protein n=1 Tax=Dietzia kunjamensis TaxID=322509 RepID=UPI002DBE1664|nr:ABC transporter ATP-binding protein [Dietzia kunjamensis]MEB8326024.1 ABC transporter ATP-binding protein [Dietzia kunjamensis]